MRAAFSSRFDWTYAIVNLSFVNLWNTIHNGYEWSIRDFLTFRLIHKGLARLFARDLLGQDFSTLLLCYSDFNFLLKFVFSLFK